MDYDSFKELLKKNKMTIKEFAAKVGINSKTISTTWCSKQETPIWVDSWFENFEKAKSFDDLKNIISQYIK